jgi:hypothetical protein
LSWHSPGSHGLEEEVQSQRELLRRWPCVKEAGEAESEGQLEGSKKKSPLWWQVRCQSDASNVGLDNAYIKSQLCWKLLEVTGSSSTNLQSCIPGSIQGGGKTQSVACALRWGMGLKVKSRPLGKSASRARDIRRFQIS